jgi:hypothetical protein
MEIETKIKRLEHFLSIGEYTIVAKESVGLIERALRLLFSQHLTRLEEKDKLKVYDAISEIGKGQRGTDSFTMGELVGVFRRSKFLDAWARVSGKDLTSLQVINLDHLTRLRNTLIHGVREATRSEAELLLHCLGVILETFEITEHSTTLIVQENNELPTDDHTSAVMLVKARDPADEAEETLLFVSYVQEDDQPPPGSDDGWVSLLLKKLQDLLSQRLSREQAVTLRVEHSVYGSEQSLTEILPTTIPLAIL